MPKPTYTSEILSSKNKEHFWRIKHRNGREICRASETYKRRFDAERGLDRMIKAIQDGKYGKLTEVATPAK